MKLRLVSPIEPPPAVGGPLATRPAALAGMKIGLLSNSKANSEALLVVIGARLIADHHAAGVVAITKPHPSLPASPSMLDTFASEVAVVITAVGD
jgi:hypothetical protein